MKHHFIRARFSAWAMVLFAAAAVLIGATTGGCSNPIVLPKTARLSASDYKPAEYPFKVTIDAYQDMRFNVHTFEVGSEKVPANCYLYLTRDTGTLNDQEFLVDVGATVSPEHEKGTIAIEDGRITIQLFFPTRSEDGQSADWAKSDVNGTYQLLRD